MVQVSTPRQETSRINFDAEFGRRISEGSHRSAHHINREGHPKRSPSVQGKWNAQRMCREL